MQAPRRNRAVRAAAFSLGANLGQPIPTLLRAVAGLAAEIGPLHVSPFYRTAPISQIPQPDFVNLAVLAWTSRSPLQLLDLAHRLEEEGGRRRSDDGAPADGPRTLDVDLLVVGDLVSTGPRLILPHPRLRQRRFVLAPLADVAPDLPVPPDGRTVGALLRDLDGREDRGGAVEQLPPPDPI
jgi:2-amino-4-hydroxy-6-hydroxymethyldihydropteridine diphosphokinase